MSHSADTLLMRLHPSHLKKHRKSKKSNKSESDSGVIVDGRGQVCCYTSSDQSESGKGTDYNINVYNFSEKGGKGKCEPVNPYSCVDIVEKIDSKSDQLTRNLSQSEIDVDGKCKGSTLSLPAGKFSSPASHCLNSRTKSADNNLDFEQRRLSCMKEAKEYESSDIYSDDGALETDPDSSNHSNHVGDDSEFNSSAKTSDSAVSRSGDSVGSRSIESTDSKKGTKVNSYIRVGNKTLTNDICEMKPLTEDVSKLCNCVCHRNNFVPVVVGNGYVTQELMATHREDQCTCQEMDEETVKLRLLKDHLQNGFRPPSQVYNLPPHFFGSMSSVPLDPARTTEL